MPTAQLIIQKLTPQPPVLTFVRTDGSTTWTRLRTLPVAHDLAHYAVETELGWRRAFFGLLNEGFSPADFELPRARRPVALLPPNLPLEVVQAEFVVNLLQAESLTGPNPDFLFHLAQALAARGLPFPEKLTEAVVGQIRACFADCLGRWQALPPGQPLHLSLPFLDS